MSKDGFTLRYMARTAAGVPRDLANTLVLSRLNHPHIAVVHDFDSENGVDFLVMELIEGETLAARLIERPVSL